MPGGEDEQKFPIRPDIPRLPIGLVVERPRTEELQMIPSKDGDRHTDWRNDAVLVTTIIRLSNGERNEIDKFLKFELRACRRALSCTSAGMETFVQIDPG